MFRSAAAPERPHDPGPAPTGYAAWSGVRCCLIRWQECCIFRESRLLVEPAFAYMCQPSERTRAGQQLGDWASCKYGGVAGREEAESPACCAFAGQREKARADISPLCAPPSALCVLLWGRCMHCAVSMWMSVVIGHVSIHIWSLATQRRILVSRSLVRGMQSELYSFD